MSSQGVPDSGLNVEYLCEFIEKKEADAYLLQLKELPFYQPTLKIRGKTVKPNRNVIGFGDSGLTYAFSGCEIPAEPWTPLMLELRDRVEKYAGCTFNFVLVNLYVDGTNSISPHKDNESGTDVTFPIIGLSFGAERIIEFKKPDSPPIRIKLEHGSLYNMQSPTNKLFTHGIAADSSVKSSRISLIFRHLIPKTVLPLAKKPRLDSSTMASGNFTIDSSVELPKNELLINFSQPANPILGYWNLKDSVFLQLLMDENLKMYIRIFNEIPGGELFPMRHKVVLTIRTWECLQRKIKKFNFQTVDDTFVANNQLLLAYVNKEMCSLQQIFPLYTQGFFLKPGVLILSREQMHKLLDYCFEVTEAIIKTMLIIQLPKLIQKTPAVCVNHMKKENAKIFLFNCILNEIELCTNKVFKCVGCDLNSTDQKLHECLTISTFEKFKMNRQSIFLNLNLYNIVNQLKNECTCYFHDTIYFKEFSVKDIENYFLDVFSKKKCK